MIEAFSLEVDLRTALDLYLFLKVREEELTGAPSELFESLREFLYDRLSIEEMEHPETLLARLDRDRR